MNNKKSSLIIFLIFAVLLISMMAYFASNNTVKMGESFIDDSQKNKKEDSSDSNNENDAATKAQKRAEDLKLFLEEPYFRLPTISIPAIKSGRLKGVLHIRVVIKVDEKKTFTVAKLLIPRIIDAIFTDLFKAFNLLWHPKYDPNPAVIQRRVMQTCQKVLGKKGLNAVLIQEFFFTRFI